MLSGSGDISSGQSPGTGIDRQNGRRTDIRDTMIPVYQYNNQIVWLHVERLRRYLLDKDRAQGKTDRMAGGQTSGTL